MRQPALFVLIVGTIFPAAICAQVYPVYRAPRNLDSPRREPAVDYAIPSAPVPSPPEPSEELLRLRRAYQDEDQFRKIRGRIYYLYEPHREWPRLDGEVSQVIPGGGLLLLLYRESDSRDRKTVHLTNHPSEFGFVDGDRVSVLAKEVGRFPYTTVLGASKTVEDYDCGKALDPAELESKRKEYREQAKPEEAKLAALQCEYIARLKAAAEQKQTQLLRSDDAALNFQIKRASEGSASAQYDLGLRYLEGKGVPKDEDRAKRLIKSAAAQGYAYAIKKLKTLE